MQPYIFPYIGYFQLMNAVDRFIVLDDVNFKKAGWINRNRLIVNGKEYLFTIQVKKSSQNKLINEINIAYDEQWSARLVTTIEQSYSKSASFSDGIDIVRKVFLSGINNLSGFILKSLYLIKTYLDIRTEIVESSSVYENDNMVGQERIINICKK